MNERIDDLLDSTPENIGYEFGGANIIPAKRKSDAGKFVNYAVQQDRWQRRVGDEFYDEYVKDSGKDMDKYAVSDFLAATWSPEVEFNPHTKETERAEYMKGVVESDEFVRLKSKTKFNTAQAQIAALSLAGSYQRWKAERQKQEQDPDQPGAPSETESASSDATAQAVKDVDEAKQAMEAMGGDGWDNSEATNDKKVNPEHLRKVFEELRNSSKLRDIMRYAGRFTAKAKSIHGETFVEDPTEFSSYRFDHDITKASPQDLSMLGDDVLEDEFMRRYADKSLLCKDPTVRAELGYGPLVILVDESGSMRGNRIAQAKGLALAMSWIARHQRRYCCFASFSGHDHMRFLEMPNGTAPVEDVMNWLVQFMSGGTSPSVLMKTIPRKWEQMKMPKGKTDVLMITDCCMPIYERDVDPYLEWKRKNQVKLMVMQVAASDDPGPELKKISDEIWKFHSLDGVQADEAIDMAMRV